MNATIKIKNYKKQWQSAQKELRQKDKNCAFVYVHLEADTGNPFYIGIGINENRPWLLSHHSRTDFHKNIIKKHGCRVEIIIDNINFDAAKFWEKSLIKALKEEGRRLVNLTEGGEGVLGYKHTKESLKKMSDAKIGKKGNRQSSSHTEKTCNLISKKIQGLWQNKDYAQKMSEAQKGKTLTEESIKKIREKMIVIRSSETDEQKETRRIKQSIKNKEAHAKKTSEERSAIGKKAAETRLRNKLLKEGIV